MELAFAKALKYCESQGKAIFELTLQDFSIVSQGLAQTPLQVMKKVCEIQKNGTFQPGIWSELEDELLKKRIQKGCEKWGNIAKLLNRKVHKNLDIRTGKHCKERWNNYLNPEVNRGPWTEEEDIILLECYKTHKNKWTFITKTLKKRTVSSVMNRIKSLVNQIKQDLISVNDLDTGIDKVIQIKKEAINKKTQNSPSRSVENYRKSLKIRIIDENGRILQ